MPSNICAVCWKEGGSACIRCKSCHYCSKECQKNDWKSHKLLCHLVAAEPERPSPSHIRAIHFPDNKPTPELIWVPCIENKETPEEPNIPHYEVTQALIGKKYPVVMKKVDWKDCQKKPTPRAIEIYHRDTFLIDGSPPTASLEAASGLHGQAKFGWRGPLVVFAISVEEGPAEYDIIRYVDATLADFRSVIHHSLHYENKPEKPRPIDPEILELAKAMGFGTVICSGDPPRRRG
ncbi:hypothetical protein F4776DRAFT_294893 [Hypoxylon sp. NC0597]|nr:hypothetical protein F4776DRAFT_294893 [Hypoxylon sp. NC0597]